jgi:hypothetical protein
MLQSCGDNSRENIHLGEKKISINISIDSIIVDVPYSSGQGNFYMEDSIITFADSYYSTFFHYDMNREEYTSKHFSRGNGPNELNKFMHAYPAYNKKQTFILDGSMFLTSFDEQFNIVKHGIIDFGWGETPLASDLGSPTNYGVMEMSDFGIYFTYLKDSSLIIPLKILVHRHGRGTEFEKTMSKNRYTKGKIFSKLNLKNMKIEEIFGNIPEIYKTSPMPHMEFFQYAVKNDTFYVNHCVDSLIYAYKYPDLLLYTIGYECDDVDRKYTITKLITEENLFRQDCQEGRSFNTGLKYIPQTNFLIRTYMKNLITGESGIQVYENNNLVGEFEMPPYFIFLGYHKGTYYGSRIIPIETEEKSEFVFYKFRLF